MTSGTGKITVFNSVFYDNNAFKNNTGILNGKMDVLNSVFDSNNCSVLVIKGDSKIKNSLFKNNTKYSIYGDSGEIFVEDTDFINNTAASIYGWNASNVIVKATNKNVLFDNPTAAYAVQSNGTSIYLAADSGKKITMNDSMDLWDRELYVGSDGTNTYNGRVILNKDINTASDHKTTLFVKDGTLENNALYAGRLAENSGKIVGTGTLSLYNKNGDSVNTGTISQKALTINSGTSLTTVADAITITDVANNFITNKGTIKLTGGSKDAGTEDITRVIQTNTIQDTIGTTQFGDGTNDAYINNTGDISQKNVTIASKADVLNSGNLTTNDLTVNSTSRLSTNANNVVVNNTFKNDGTLNLTGGNLSKVVTGSGKIEISGDVSTSSAYIIQHLTINSGNKLTAGVDMLSLHDRDLTLDGTGMLDVQNGRIETITVRNFIARGGGTLIFDTILNGSLLSDTFVIS